MQLINQLRPLLYTRPVSKIQWYIMPAVSMTLYVLENIQYSKSALKPGSICFSGNMRLLYV